MRIQHNVAYAALQDHRLTRVAWLPRGRVASDACRYAASGAMTPFLKMKQP
jgi:hypothetical protein